MHVDYIEWDEDDDPRGNVQHMGHNGVTPEEFLEVLDAAHRDNIEPSVSHPENWTTTGETVAGRTLRIVFELDEADPDFIYVRPITGYEPEDGS
jgi:hypothetical protein